MNRIIFCILLISIGCSNNNQREVYSDVVEGFQREHLKEYAIIIDSLLPAFVYLIEDSASYEYKLLQKYLHKEDFEFMKAQIQDSSFLTWEDKNFKNLTILTKNQKKYRSQQDGFKYCAYSKPLLSVDKRYALLWYDCYCGSWCSDGKVVLIKNENGVWVIKEELKAWTS